MVIVLFRSKLTRAAGEDYAAMADEMVERARSMPGFVDFRSYSGDAGERLALVWWEDEESMAAWRDDARHRVAQQAGRDRWYSWFDLEVAHRVRQTQFERDA
jgi:heme-degrading monooxygenase HmoA